MASQTMHAYIHIIGTALRDLAVDDFCVLAVLTAIASGADSCRGATLVVISDSKSCIQLA
eukprot:21259-Heterococcus_DN1.PRE.2